MENIDFDEFFKIITSLLEKGYYTDVKINIREGIPIAEYTLIYIE